jgi:hypothetical protein
LISRDDQARERRQRQWHTTVERALAAVVAVDIVVGLRCQKCLLPKHDRRRPARHHRVCPLRGAGTWRGILGLVQWALSARTFGSMYPIAPHILAWTLARVLSMGRGSYAGPPQVDVDHALDRFCGVLRFPAVLPLSTLYLAAIDQETAKGLSTSMFLPLCHHDGLAAFTMDPRTATRSTLRLYRLPPLVPAALWSDTTPQFVPRSVGTLDLEARLFRAPDHQGEVWAYTERGTAEEPLLVVGEAAQALARIDAFPGPERMRLRARRETARRFKVELPEQRAERLRLERRERYEERGRWGRPLCP